MKSKQTETRFRFNKEMKDWLQANCYKYTSKQISEVFNREFDVTLEERKLVNHIRRSHYGLKPLRPSYTPELLSEIQTLINEGLTSEKISEVLNVKYGNLFTKDSIMTARRDFKLKIEGKHHWNSVFTLEQEDYALKNYKGIMTVDLLEKMNKEFEDINITIEQLRYFLYDRGLKNGMDTRFGYDNPYEIEREIGSEYFQQQKNAVFIKTEKGIVRKGRYVWEKHNGEIPEGYSVTMLDGDPRNCEIENLVLISNQEAIFAHVHIGKTDNVEVNSAIYNLAKLTSTIKNKENDNE